MNPKVSIIIPVYNTECYLHECMDSILDQTYKEIEVIVVDDGSTDHSADIIRSYTETDQRVICIEEEHKNAGAARNLGMTHATGEFIVFLDADDIFMPELIEKHVSLMNTHNADISICGCSIFDNENGLEDPYYDGSVVESYLPQKSVFSSADVPGHIFQITNTWVWDKMYRLSFLREYGIRFQEINTTNDALFCCLAYAEANRITAMTERLVRHRTNVVTSIEYTRAPNWFCAFEMLDTLKNELISRGLYEAVERSFVNLAAARVAFYVLNITSAVQFPEIYRYCRQTALNHYSFLSYPIEYYHDGYIYNILIDLKTLDEIGFLCARRKELEDQVREITGVLHETQENLRIQVKERGDLIYVCGIKSWRFPFRFDTSCSETSIVLYGYGDVGRDYSNWIIHGEGLRLVAVADKKYREYQSNEIKVIAPGDITKEVFDYIIIAIFDRNIAEEIRADLVKYGIPERKILWSSPIPQIEFCSEENRIYR